MGVSEPERAVQNQHHECGYPQQCSQPADMNHVWSGIVHESGHRWHPLESMRRRLEFSIFAPVDRFGCAKSRSEAVSCLTERSSNQHLALFSSGGPSAPLDSGGHMQFQNVIFPVDCSGRSRAATRFIHSMAKRYGATVHLIHAVPPLPALYFDVASAYTEAYDPAALPRRRAKGSWSSRQNSSRTSRRVAACWTESLQRPFFITRARTAAT